MLDALRNLAKSWIAMILIGFLVLSFALWGIADIFTGIGATTVATVGDQEIGAQEFQRAYNAEIREINRRIGTPLTPQQAAALGVPNRVLGRLATDAAFASNAEELGLGISDDELARLIQNDPALRGTTGRFNADALRRWLASNGLSENEFVLERKQAALRRQVEQAIAGNMQVPQTYLQAFNTFQNEERSIEYITLTTAQLGPVKTPSETELKAFYEQEKQSFIAPELRAFRLLVLDPESLADPASVSDEDALAQYEAVKTVRYGAPERRNFQQLRFVDADAAAAAAAKLAEGASFQEVAEAEGHSPADLALGLKAKSEIVDPAIAEAVFALPLEGVSEPVTGRFGTFIVKVTEISEGASLPFEEVKDPIKREIATREAESRIFKLYDEIEDARAGGTTLVELAKRLGLTLREVEQIDRRGMTLDGAAVELPERDRLLAEVFQSEVDEEANPVQVGTRGFAWFNVTEIVPERERGFEEARDKVAAAWRDRQIETRLDETAADIVAKLKAGQSLAELAEPFGVPVATATQISRGSAPEGVSSDLADAVFDGPEGMIGVANGEDADTRVVFRVTEANAPGYFAEASGNQQAREQLVEALRNTIMQQYVLKSQQELGIRVNNQVLGYVIGTESAPGTR